MKLKAQLGVIIVDAGVAKAGTELGKSVLVVMEEAYKNSNFTAQRITDITSDWDFLNILKFFYKILQMYKLPLLTKSMIYLLVLPQCLTI